jgi:hypothetical protein
MRSVDARRNSAPSGHHGVFWRDSLLDAHLAAVVASGPDPLKRRWLQTVR